MKQGASQTLFIAHPSCGIEADIFAGFPELDLIPNDVLVISSLPDNRLWTPTFPANALRRDGLEGTNNCRDRPSSERANSPRSIGRQSNRRFAASYVVSQDHNSMYMVWHHDVRGQFHSWEMGWDREPALVDDFPKIAECDLFAYDCSEKALFAVRANCKEISGRPRIIEAFQSDGAPIWKCRVLGHRSRGL
jgi:hypothetical protein